MDRLHQMMRVATVCLILGGLRVVFAADYCSLVVRVLSPDGRRPQALVSVLEKDGRLIERNPTSEDSKFCDLGIASVTVKVGADGTCNQVVVRDVPLVWQEEFLLTVTYDLEPCLRESPPPPVPICWVLFRVSDVGSKWLEKATIRFRGSGLAPLETDNAGRARLALTVGDQIAGNVDSNGHVGKTFSVSCSRAEPLLEVPIKLERLPGQ